MLGPGLGVPGLTIRFTSDDSGVLLGFQAEVSTAPPTLVMSQQYEADDSHCMQAGKQSLRLSYAIWLMVVRMRRHGLGEGQVEGTVMVV